MITRVDPDPNRALYADSYQPEGNKAMFRNKKFIWIIFLAFPAVISWMITGGHANVRAGYTPVSAAREPSSATGADILCWQISGGIPMANAVAPTGGGAVSLGQYIPGERSNGTIRFRFGLAGCQSQAQAVELADVEAVNISGPTAGDINVDYSFSAQASPDDATPPITYEWSPAPKRGQGSTIAVYSWADAGSRTINVTISNNNGSATASDAHTITLSPAVTGRMEVFMPIIKR